MPKALFELSFEAWFAFFKRDCAQALRYADKYPNAWLAMLELKLKTLSEANDNYPAGQCAALVKNPELAFASEANLENLLSPDWEWVLERQPSLIEKAKEYPSGWVAILVKNPELVSGCKYLKHFYEWEWQWILEKHPQLSVFAQLYKKV